MTLFSWYTHSKTVKKSQTSSEINSVINNKYSVSNHMWPVAITPTFSQENIIHVTEKIKKIISS